MFYKAENELREIALEEISDTFLTIGIVSGEELEKIKDNFGFSEASAEKCRRANPLFRTEVEVYGNYTFTELRVPNGSGDDDYIALFLKKNLILVIDIFDRDGSTMDIFRRVIDRFPAEKINTAKVVCAFMESLVSDSGAIIEIHATSSLAWKRK